MPAAVPVLPKIDSQQQGLPDLKKKVSETYIP
jgi:hypothetical protein